MMRTQAGISRIIVFKAFWAALFLVSCKAAPPHRARQTQQFPYVGKWSASKSLYGGISKLTVAFDNKGRCFTWQSRTEGAKVTGYWTHRIRYSMRRGSAVYLEETSAKGSVQRGYKVYGLVRITPKRRGELLYFYPVAWYKIDLQTSKKSPTYYSKDYWVLYKIK